MGFLDWPEAAMEGDPDACPNHKHCPDCGKCLMSDETVHEWDCEIKPPPWMSDTASDSEEGKWH